MLSNNILKKIENWQLALKEMITEPEILFERLDLDRQYLAAAKRVCQLFPLRVTDHFLSKMVKGDINDPLLKQILPLELEEQLDPNFVADPLGERYKNPIPGLLHKYHNRVLIMLTKACAIHCRYCFRRSFLYEQNQIGEKERKQIFAYLQAHPEIEEVILSGGDPLVVTDKILSKFIQSLEAISHLKRLRFHSRLPVILPDRITPQFLRAITQNRLQIIMVIHCNHPNEIDEPVIQALQKMRERNILLLNQTVLLKGINDNADILIKLSDTLFQAGVLPYYLHLLDRVNGTKHFDIAKSASMALYHEFSKRVSGYLLPKLVRETDGQPYKQVYGQDILK